MLENKLNVKVKIKNVEKGIDFCQCPMPNFHWVGIGPLLRVGSYNPNQMVWGWYMKKKIYAHESGPRATWPLYARHYLLRRIAWLNKKGKGLCLK